jgi:hypothetical protein
VAEWQPVCALGRGGTAPHGLRRSAPLPDPRSAGGSKLRGSVKNGSSCATPLSAERGVGASEAHDAFVLLLPLFSRGRPGWGLIYLGSGLAGSALVGWGDLPTCRWRGRQGGKRPCPLDPWPLVYADCRDSPAFWAALHRPGATRHPWRDAPFAVILTAHRLQSPQPTARQTAWSFVGNSQAGARLPSPSVGWAELGEAQH